MPNFDKMGPAGQGPMTGQGLGHCSGSRQSDMGSGMGVGGGRRCWGRGVLRNSSISLEDQEKSLENRLEAVRKLKKNANSQK